MTTTAETGLLELGKLDPVELYTNDGVSQILQRITRDAKSIVIDISSERGRKECASVAHKISRAKTALDDMGKELVSEWKEKSKAVDNERKRLRDTLDALRDEVRKPLTDWEDKEKLRVENHNTVLTWLTTEATLFQGQPTTVAIRERLAQVQKESARDWEEFTARATAATAEAIAKLTTQLTAREKFDADQVELARLRQESEARAQKEREEAIAAAAAQKAKDEAEAKARKLAEQAQREKDAAAAQLKAAEAARVEAEKRAKEAEKAAAEKAKREAEAKAKAEADALSKREADKAHRKRIADEISKAITMYTDASVPQLVEALMDGKIPHVKVIF